MAGLADAFRTQWPPVPPARDPMMPVPMMPQAQRLPFDLDALMQQPLQRTERPIEPPSRLMPSPGFADFLRNYWLEQRRL